VGAIERKALFGLIAAVFLAVSVVTDSAFAIVISSNPVIAVVSGLAIEAVILLVACASERGASISIAAEAAARVTLKTFMLVSGVEIELR
jgi:hypothetical protein